MKRFVVLIALLLVTVNPSFAENKLACYLSDRLLTDYFGITSGGSGSNNFKQLYNVNQANLTGSTSYPNTGNNCYGAALSNQQVLNTCTGLAGSSFVEDQRTAGWIYSIASATPSNGDMQNASDMTAFNWANQGANGGWKSTATPTSGCFYLNNAKGANTVYSCSDQEHSTDLWEFGILFGSKPFSEQQASLVSTYLNPGEATNNASANAYPNNEVNTACFLTFGSNTGGNPGSTGIPSSSTGEYVTHSLNYSHRAALHAFNFYTGSLLKTSYGLTSVAGSSLSGLNSTYWQNFVDDYCQRQAVPFQDQPSSAYRGAQGHTISGGVVVYVQPNYNEYTTVTTNCVPVTSLDSVITSGVLYKPGDVLNPSVDTSNPFPAGACEFENDDQNYSQYSLAANAGDTTIPLPSGKASVNANNIYMTNSWAYTSGTASDYSNDIHSTAVSGECAFFTFTPDASTTVSFITRTESDAGPVVIYLDGVYQATVQCYAVSPSFQQVVWTSGSLTNAQHTLRVVNNGGTIYVDAFQYTTGSVLTTVNDNTTSATYTNGTITYNGTQQIGMDISYQGFGMQAALALAMELPDSTRKTQLVYTLTTEGHFLLTRMNADGSANITGCCRDGIGQQRNAGAIKTYDYRAGLYCLVGMYYLTGDPDFYNAAIKMANSQHSLIKGYNYLQQGITNRATYLNCANG